MIYLWATVLTILNGAWLVLTLLTLPGNWLMLGGARLAASVFRDPPMFSLWTLIVCTVLAIADEVIEFIASAVAVNRVHGTKIGGWGSLLGSVAGGVVGSVVIPVPVLGAMIGVVAGAIVGEVLFEPAAGGTWGFSARSGLAAGSGRVAGTVGKFAVGILIWIILAVAAFWP